ncbi:MAG: hypothetical protein R3220_11610 [Balneolaceae bacterium]|nr:hypothetical protein [Balneolaceae bacterium]
MMAVIDEFFSELKKYVAKYRSWKRRVFLKKTNYYKTLIQHKIRSISFKTRNEKIDEFDRIIASNPEIYFTTDLTKTGFTDQLIGFSFLYKVGLGLGLKYYHTRLSSHRSSVPFLFYPYSKEKLPDETHIDVFDFLGLNSFLESHAGKPLSADVKKYRVNLKTILSRTDNIHSYESLLDEMKVILHPYLKENRKILLTLECYPITYFKFYQFVQDRTEHALNYRDIFEKWKIDIPYESKFKENTLKMMVHIRQGDTGTIKTPWNTFIPTWHRIEGKYTQFKKMEDISFHKLIDPDDFYRFLKELSESIKEKEFSAVLFSDGFKKTFKAIYQSYRSKNISDQEIEKLKEIEADYDENEFSRFRELGRVETVIGEEIEKLYDFIYSFMEADILIFGTQGSLIPKMLSTYGNRSEMPLMIMLYKSNKSSLIHLGIDNTADYLIHVNIDNFDIRTITRKIEKYLKERNFVTNSTGKAV